MAIVEGVNIGWSLGLRGQLGRMAKVRAGLLTFEEAQAACPFAGSWQIRHTRKGRRFSQGRPTGGIGAFTAPKAARWVILAAGVVAWRLLTDEQKLSYNKRARPFKFSGYNLFLREYLQTH